MKVRESLGYLMSDPNISITYDGKGSNKMRLVAYSDFDHRSHSIFAQSIPPDDTKHNRSISCYAILAGSSAIAYKAKLQSRIIHSSKETEFNAAFLYMQHIKNLQGLLKELGFPQICPGS